MANTIPERSYFSFLSLFGDALIDEVQSTNSPFPEKRWNTAKKHRKDANLVIWWDNCMKKALFKCFSATPVDYETKALQKHMLSWFMDRQNYIKEAA